MFLPPEAQHGAWLPLHLALAGGATTAIAAALPFFTTSLLSEAPAPAPLRALAIGLVAAGAIAIVLGVASGNGSSQGGAVQPGVTALGVAPAGGLLFIVGILLVGWTAFWPARGSIGRRHRLVLVSYAAAIADVAVGAMLATLYLGGYTSVVTAWARLMPAHAWLNLLGFVSLTVAATLIHLYPTVLGTRIPTLTVWPGQIVLLAASCLIAGPILVAAGYALDSGIAVRAGAAAEMTGAAALAIYGLAVWRRRGRWRTDGEWHLAIAGHLSAAIAWFVAGVGLAAVPALVAGADPSGWSVERVVAPLGLGCIVQAIVGSWTHLVPSIGPGDAEVHARQRRILARSARIRLVAFQAATLALLPGLSLDYLWLTLAGVALALAAGAGSLGLLLLALVEARLPFRAAFRGSQRP